ncbi:MAG: hypothetical protein AAFP26_01070 [Planctomycetota bacterium]
MSGMRNQVGTDDGLNEALQIILAGGVPDRGVFHTRTQDFYHNRALPNTNSTLTFFNEAPQEHVTNWPSQGGLQNDEFFVCTSVEIDILQGYDINGGAVAAASAYGTGQGPYTIAEQIRAALVYGLFSFRVGDKTEIDSFGLSRFPSRGGVHAFASSELDNQAAAAERTLAMVSNGPPEVYNVEERNPAIVIPPNRTCAATMKWQPNIAFEGALVASVVLSGIRCSYANT